MSDTISLARSYLQNSFKAQERARDYLAKYDFDKSIRESQESIEFAIKAIYYAFGLKPPKSHNFTEDDFKKLLDTVQANIDPAGPKISAVDFQKPYLYSRFWGTFYETAKYGLEKLHVGPGNLFQKDEADLALKHAGFCVGIANVAVNFYAAHAPKHSPSQDSEGA